jgi:hypothetical protein
MPLWADNDDDSSLAILALFDDDEVREWAGDSEACDMVSPCETIM